MTPASVAAGVVQAVTAVTAVPFPQIPRAESAVISAVTAVTGAATTVVCAVDSVFGVVTPACVATSAGCLPMIAHVDTVPNDFHFSFFLGAVFYDTIFYSYKNSLFTTNCTLFPDPPNLFPDPPIDFPAFYVRKASESCVDLGQLKRTGSDGRR